MIYEWLNSLSLLINENMWLAPLLCVLAGALTTLTPCSLSTIPLVISYVGGTSADIKKSFKLSLVFAIGNSITFIIFGIVAALLGQLIGNTGKWWYIVLGILMILMALQVLEIYQFIPSTYLTEKNTFLKYDVELKPVLSHISSIVRSVSVRYEIARWQIISCFARFGVFFKTDLK